MARIVDLRAYVVQSGQGDYHAQAAGHWLVDSPIATPMGVYPAYRTSRTAWGIDVLKGVLVEVETDTGQVGIGLSTGGEPACFLIERHFRRFVVGQDPRDIERLWDQMWRASLPYGRKGLALHAVSAVDLALWDVLGKLRGEPVYALLGGRTKERLPVYATTPRPAVARALGFWGAKVPLPHGPAEGVEGLRRNLAVLEGARAAVGEDFPLMVDCYMALTVPYAIDLLRGLRPVGLTWLEEPLLPDDYDGLAQIKAAVPEVVLATGEHEYTRYGFREIIARRAVGVLQPDLTWVGGVTEGRRIAALAAAYDLMVIPHAGGVFSYHFCLATPNCPLAEYMMMAPQADRVVPTYGGLLQGEPVPEGGEVRLPDRPGWGVAVDPTAPLVRPYPEGQPASRPERA